MPCRSRRRSLATAGAWCWSKWPLEYGDHWFDILKTKNVSAYEADFIEFIEITEKSAAEDID